MQLNVVSVDMYSNKKSRCKTIMLLITYKCNLICTYCYEPKISHNSINETNAKKYIEDIVSSLSNEYDEFEVQFMGGEPLMEFSLIKEVSEWLWTQYFPISLKHIFAPTNGTLLTEEMKSWFTEHKNKICLGLSFDGNRLMQNINRSKSYNSVDLHFFSSIWPKQSVKMTISPHTLQNLYEGVIFLYSKGFRYITVDLAMGKHILWKQKHLKVLSEQLSQLSSYYLHHSDMPLISMLNINIEDVLQKHSSFKKCGCGEDLVCVDCDGSTYGCHLFAPISASKELAEKSLSIDFSNHDSFVSETCHKCLLYPVCTICYGMNYLNTGDIKIQHPFICQAFKIQFLSSCKLQLQLANIRGDDEKEKLINDIINNF